MCIGGEEMAKKIDMENIQSLGTNLAVLSDIVWGSLVQLKGKVYPDVALTSFKIEYAEKGCALTWGIRVGTFYSYADWTGIRWNIKELLVENLKPYNSVNLNSFCHVSKVAVSMVNYTSQYVDYVIVFNLST